MDGNFRLLENFADVVVYNRHNQRVTALLLWSVGLYTLPALGCAVVGILRVDEVSLM